ncbi:MAG: hypothetical protein VXW65_14160, partial [Pseudomonadota bacterium]|nr:hypothetical protein [Pseudomonadota bacterium]
LIVNNLQMEQFLEQLIRQQTGGGNVKPQTGICNQSYQWGEVFLIDWGKLGFAPGGTESFLLPHQYHGVYVGFFCFDWQSLKISF